MNEKKEKSLWEKIKQVAVIALATLGVLFIIVMVLPEDEEPDAQEPVAEEYVDEDYADEEYDEEELAAEEIEQEEAEPEAEEEAGDAEVTVAETESPQESAPSGNVVSVNIPASEISGEALSFKAATLDNETVSQDIFKDYDITVVHLWGTFCQPCIAEMGEYAAFYRELPDNINLVGLISDVYDGLDSNVSRAHEILGNAGAEFVNIRTSDDLYGVVSEFQYVPSSFFVDSEGHIIGSVLDGAGIEETKSRLSTYLE